MDRSCQNFVDINFVVCFIESLRVYVKNGRLIWNTVMCLSIGTHLKIINFPFVPNGKCIIVRFPKIWAHYNLIIMCLNIGTANNHHFPFVTNGKVVVLGVPILK